MKVLECIRRRRVTRFFTADEVTGTQLMQVLEAGRWAPSAGNRRLHRFVVVSDPVLIRLVRLVSPGIRGYPTALVVICIDWSRAARLHVRREDRSTYIDVGTVTQNMLLAAEEMGLGAGPVTSFSRTAVATILELPDSMAAEMIVCLGHRAPHQTFSGTRPAEKIILEDLIFRKGLASRSG